MCRAYVARPFRTAGPDAIRSLAPKQIYALEWRITLDGFFQSSGFDRFANHVCPHESAGRRVPDNLPSGKLRRYC
jgi:hypothetical protein